MSDFDDYWRARQEEEDFRPRAARHEAAIAYEAGANAILLEAAYQLRYGNQGGTMSWVVLSRWLRKRQGLDRE